VLLLSIWLARGVFAVPRSARATDLAVIMVGSFFGIGPWVAAIQQKWTLPYESTDILVKAYFACALFLIGIYLGQKPVRTRANGVTVKTLMDRSSQISILTIIVLEATMWAYKIILGQKYGIFFSGTATQERVESLPYILVIAGNITYLLRLVSLVWASATLNMSDSARRKTVAAFILFSNLVAAFLEGRRWLLLVVVSMAVTTAMYKMKGQVQWIRKRAILVVALVGCFMLFPFFLSVRQTYFSRERGDDAVQAFVDSAKEASMSDDNSGAQRDNWENMAQRTMMIRFVCNIFGSQENYSPMAGEAFGSTLVWVIPSVFLKSKRGMVQTEQLIERYYRQPEVDVSSTWVSLGCADFGLPGAFLAGLILGLAMGAVENWAGKQMVDMPILSLAACGGLISLAWNVESDPTDLWGFIRALLLIWIPTVLVKRAIRKPKLGDDRAVTFNARQKHHRKPEKSEA
jgi:hypothetical protein